MRAIVRIVQMGNTNMVTYAAFLALMAASNIWAQVEQPTTETAKEQIELRITSFDASGDHLDLHYEIDNNSPGEIWICDDVDIDSAIEFEIIASLDGSTLLIRERLGIPLGWWRFIPPSGRYVPVASGGRYAATVRIALPVRQQPVLTSRSAHHPEQLGKANRVILEVGYIPGDLPAKVAALVRDGDKAHERSLAEKDELHIEEQKLTEQFLQLHKMLEESTAAEERERLQAELHEVELPEERLDGAIIAAWARSFVYLEGLDIQIPEFMLMDLETIGRASEDSEEHLSIPHSYTQHVERERFLRCIVKGVQVLHLPPRYLDLTGTVPWQKTRLD